MRTAFSRTSFLKKGLSKSHPGTRVFLIYQKMDRKAVVVLLTFVVSITPSLSDAVQINHDYEGAWKWVALWYLILLVILSGLWEHL